MTDIVAELRRLDAAALQGEWGEWEVWHDAGTTYVIQPLDEYFDRIVCTVRSDSDAPLIVAMHNHLPALLDRLEWLEDRVRSLEMVESEGNN